MSLSKVWVVAATEFGLLVRTKAFILGVLLLPVLIVGFGFLQSYLMRKPDQKTRHFSVLDSSGKFFKAVAAKAGKKQGSAVEAHLAELQGKTLEEVRHEQLEKVRQGELFAYLEIPPHIAGTGKAASNTARYYSNTPSHDELRWWLEWALNDEVRRLRFKAQGVPYAVVERAEKKVVLENLNLTAGSPGPLAHSPDLSGEAKAEKVTLPRVLLPAALMFVLFFAVILTAPQMMTAVIEEKMSRISEVLLASVTPFELMLGKLTANCGVSLLVGVIYLSSGWALAAHYGYTGLLTLQQAALFFLFQILAVFLHGSMYLAVGAACNQPKDAQGMMTPLMLVTMLPMMVFGPLMQDPSGKVATSLSFFPPTAPFIMLFRMSSQPPPPTWHLLLSVLVTLASVFFCVWAASRIFRIGLLAQGKTPGFMQLFRWIFMR